MSGDADEPKHGETATQSVMANARDIIILYGSETGNSEDIAMELADMTRRLHFRTEVDEMDNFKLKTLAKSTLVIFVTSTTGQGDMPMNAGRFWKNLLRSSLNGTNCLGRVKFALFGLGDSSYPKFNWAARKLRERLLRLGATEFCKAGEGDERHEEGIDSVYLPWQQELHHALLTLYPLPASLEPIPDHVQLPPKIVLRFDEEATPLTYDRDLRKTVDKDNILKDHPGKYSLEGQQEPSFVESMEHFNRPATFIATVKQNDRVTPQDHWQDVRVLSLRIPTEQPFPQQVPDSHVGLQGGTRANLPVPIPGSTVTIWPKNSSKDAELLIEMMGWWDEAYRPLAPKPLREKVSYDRQTGYFRKTDRGITLHWLLIHYYDITATPKISFIRQLLFYTKRQLELDRLHEMLDGRNRQEFYDYVSRPRRTIIEVLMDFPGVKIPWDHAHHVFPIIRGRQFSIANGGSSLHGPEYKGLGRIDNDRWHYMGNWQNGRPDGLSVEIIVAMVKFKTIIRRARQGLCSRYLKELQPDTMIQISFNSNTMLLEAGGRVRRNPSMRADGLLVDSSMVPRPIIAIATGTGIAPVRAFMQERATLCEHMRVMPGKTLVFFGCRSAKADFFFQEEWAVRVTRGEVTLYPAFSRDPVDDEKTRDGLDPYRDDKSTVVGSVGIDDPGNDVNMAMKVWGYDKGKNYVQHHIRMQAAAIVDLLAGAQGFKPLIMVCGNAGRMPLSVRVALGEALISQGRVTTRAEAAAWLGDAANVDFWQETW